VEVWAEGTFSLEPNTALSAFGSECEIVRWIVSVVGDRAYGVVKGKLAGRW